MMGCSPRVRCRHRDIRHSRGLVKDRQSQAYHRGLRGLEDSSPDGHTVLLWKAHGKCVGWCCC